MNLDPVEEEKEEDGSPIFTINYIKNMVKQNPNLYYQTYELNDCLYLNYKGFTYLKNMHLF